MQANALDVRGFQRFARIPVATSQTIKQGDILLLNSSGYAIQGCAAGSRLPVAVSGAQTGRVLGRATEDITTGASVTTERVGVIIAEPGTQFAMPCYHATEDTRRPALANLGLPFEVIRVNDDPDYYAVSLDNTTNKKVKIVEMFEEDYQDYPQDSTGIVDGRVWVEFLLNQCALAGGDMTSTVD
jgi:hypothetical protein